MLLTLLTATPRLLSHSCSDMTQASAPMFEPTTVSIWLQLAPYCTQYERLAAHLEAAGVAVEPNLWDQAVSLAREHRHLAPDSPKGSLPDGRADASSAPVGPRLTTQLLPANKLLPFMVPFRGGPGSLCGGAATFSTRCVPHMITCPHLRFSHQEPVTALN